MLSISSGEIAKVDENVQLVTTKLELGRYTPIIVQKGILVKWIITSTDSDLNGCNNRINIPGYNIENKSLVPRKNIIEFTPNKKGNYIYMWDANASWLRKSSK